MKNPNVFMQVIVKNALEEDKRVARYPKAPNNPSIRLQTAKPSQTPLPRHKNFMQLIYDNSSLKGKPAATKNSNPNPTSSFDHSKLSQKVFPKPDVNDWDSAFDVSEKNSNTKSDHINALTFFDSKIEATEAPPSSYGLNELLVKNDPESFKRSIAHEHHNSKKIPDPTEITPHPRGGPDSHDVFQLDFNGQLPDRPSFTFTQPKHSIKHHRREKFESSPVDKPISKHVVPTTPTTYSKKRHSANQKDYKAKHNNIVWEKFAKNSRPNKPVQYSKKERRKTNYKEKLTKVKPSWKGYGLPSTHPLRSILPKSARVVGIQSIKRKKAWLGQGVGRKDRRPHIMTVEDFLKRYPNMNKIRGAIPVPVRKQKHIRMIELLASQLNDNTEKNRFPNYKNQVEITLHPKRQISQNNIFSNSVSSKTHEESRSTTHSENRQANLDNMLKELDMLIAERAEKRVIHFRPLNNSPSYDNSIIKEQEDLVLPKDNHLNPLQDDHSKLKDSKNDSVTAIASIRPRGEGPSLRFTSTTKPNESSLSYSSHEEIVTSTPSIFTASPKPLTTKNAFELSPIIEFGFKPITTSSRFSFATSTLPPMNKSSPFQQTFQDFVPPPSLLPTPMKSSDPYQTVFDSVNELTETHNVEYPPRYPRLIPSVFGSTGKYKKNNVLQNSFSSDNRIKGDTLNINSLDTIVSDPFFFTTTTAKPIVFSQNDVDSLFPPSTSGISSTLFDMRKFFFIPNRSKSKSTKTNLVTGSSFQKSGNRRVWRKPLRRSFFPRISL